MLLKSLDHPGIALSVYWQLGLLILSLIAYAFDKRKIMGVNPWLKPIKFEVSVAIFLLTLGVLLSQLNEAYSSPGASRIWTSTASLVAWTAGITMIVENSLIALQSLRGVRSHMNYITVLDTAIFNVMGLAILLNTVALGVVFLLYLDPMTIWQWPTAVNSGIRLGLAVFILGSIEGVVMVNNQHHLVGTGPDRAIPLVNWSTTKGDLRIAHFFGLHALQAFPLFGWLLSRTGLPGTAQVAAVMVFAAAYLAVCAWLFRVAIRGQSPLRFWNVESLGK